MVSFYLSNSFTVGRVLVVGILAYVIFMGLPEWGSASITAFQLFVAVAAAIVGVIVGFRLPMQHSIIAFLSKANAHNFRITAGVGFLFLGLWASEGGSPWLLPLWCFPAGVLEAIASKIDIKYQAGQQ